MGMDRPRGFVTAVQMNQIKHAYFYTVALAYAAGTGTGYSVLDMVAAMKKASGKDVGALRSPWVVKYI